MKKTAKNEKAKLTATFCNNLGVATAATATIGTLLNYGSYRELFMIGGIGFVLAVCLHIIGRTFLDSLED
jgi:hypothetical protein